MTICLQEDSAANKIGVIVFLICNIGVFFSDLALTSFETHSEYVSNKVKGNPRKFNPYFSTVPAYIINE